ncbi:MAG: hypothetical protein ACTSVB_03785 [Candidatus Heimdallarchaeaceae archaeon]
MKKQIAKICGLLLILVFISSTTSAARRPLPPEIEVLIADSYYTGRNLYLAFDQIERDAAKCGIRLNLVVQEFYTVATRIFAGDYEAVLYIGLVGSYSDTWDSILETLLFLKDILYTNNEEFSSLIEELWSLYNSEASDNELLPIFHEFEFLLYDELYIPTFFWYIRETEENRQDLYTFHYIFNCEKIQDKAVRKALMYLTDLDLIIDVIGNHIEFEIHPSSHLFAYSSYHDTSLPDYYYNIGKATSILAHAGYRPAHIK